MAVREAPRLLEQVKRQTRTPGPSRGPRPSGARTDHQGAPRDGRRITYSPDLDGRADPGEVVWTWVAYEEEDGRGKDRPVLVVGREGAGLLALMLTSNKRRDDQHGWLALGPGAWDREDRPSWVRLDRVLQLTEDGIRREGAILARDRFDRVAAALRKAGGWQ